MMMREIQKEKADPTPTISSTREEEGRRVA